MATIWPLFFSVSSSREKLLKLRSNVIELFPLEEKNCTVLYKPGSVFKANFNSKSVKQKPTGYLQRAFLNYKTELHQVDLLVLAEKISDKLQAGSVHK